MKSQIYEQAGKNIKMNTIWTLEKQMYVYYETTNNLQNQQGRLIHSEVMLFQPTSSALGLK